MTELTLNWPSGLCRRKKIPGPQRWPLTKAEKWRWLLTATPAQLADPRLYPRGAPAPIEGTSYWIFERTEEATVKPVHNIGLLYKRLMTERPEDFVRKYGFLWSRGESEMVRDFFSARRELRKLVAFKKDDNWDWAREWMEARPHVVQLDGVIGKDEKGRPQLEFQPRHLFGFIVAQLIQDWSGGKTYKFCKNPGCDEYFYYGPKTDHRNTAEYCSKKCNLAHAYQMRKEQVK